MSYNLKQLFDEIELVIGDVRKEDVTVYIQSSRDTDNSALPEITMSTTITNTRGQRTKQHTLTIKPKYSSSQWDR